MANAIVEAVLIDEFRSLVAKGSTAPVADLERELPRIVLTVGALRAMVTHVEAESTDAGIKRIAAAMEKARTAERVSVVASQGFGLVRVGDGDHVDRIAKLAAIRGAEDEADRLRKVAVKTPEDAQAQEEARAAADRVAKLREPAPTPEPKRDVVQKRAYTAAELAQIGKADREFVAAQAEAQTVDAEWRAAGSPQSGALYDRAQQKTRAVDAAIDVMNRVRAPAWG